MVRIILFVLISLSFSPLFSAHAAKGKKAPLPAPIAATAVDLTRRGGSHNFDNTVSRGTLTSKDCAGRLESYETFDPDSDSDRNGTFEGGRGYDGL